MVRSIEVEGDNLLGNGTLNQFDAGHLNVLVAHIDELVVELGLHSLVDNELVRLLVVFDTRNLGDGLSVLVEQSNLTVGNSAQRATRSVGHGEVDTDNVTYLCEVIEVSSVELDVLVVTSSLHSTCSSIPDNAIGRSNLGCSLLVKVHTGNGDISPVGTLDSIQVSNTLVGKDLCQVNGNDIVLVGEVLVFPSSLRELNHMRFSLCSAIWALMHIAVHHDTRSTCGIGNIEFAVLSQVGEVQIAHAAITIRQARGNKQLIRTSGSRTCSGSSSAIPMHKHGSRQFGEAILQCQSSNSISNCSGSTCQACLSGSSVNKSSLTIGYSLCESTERSIGVSH